MSPLPLLNYDGDITTLHDFTFPQYLNELLQFGAVFEFGIAVQQKSSMVCIGQGLQVERLQISSEVVDTLSVQEFPNNVRRFQLPYSSGRGSVMLQETIYSGSQNKQRS